MFKNLKKKAQEAAASAKDAAASASTAVASATQNATQQVSGKMNNISSSGMSDKQISAKLYEYLVGNDEEKFDVLAEHSLRSNNLPDDQKKSKTRFVFHKWSENPLKMPLLLAAVYYNNHKIVKIMLKYKDMFDINQEVDKKTALYMAIAYNDDYKMARLLIDHGAEVNNPNNPVFWYAVKSNNLDMVRLLIDSGFDWDGKVNHVYRDRESDFEFNVPSGADMDITDTVNDPKLWKMSVFHLCCYYGYIEILEYLLCKEKKKTTKLDIFAKTSHLLHAANDNEKDKKKKKGKESQIGANGFVLACCRQDNLPMIKYLISSVYISSQILMDENESKLAVENLINSRDYTGNTPLLYAAGYGNSDLVSLLIDKYPKDIDVNKPDRNTNQTALITACRKNHVQCVKALLKGTYYYIPENKRLDINAKDNANRTALMYAIDKGNHRCVQLVCNPQYTTNIKFDEVDKDGKDMFQYCAFYGQIACFHSILANFLRSNKIESWNELKASRILEEEKMALWLELARAGNNQQYVGFLHGINKRVITPKDLGLLYSMISHEIDATKEQEMRDRLKEYSKAVKVCDYLMSQCDENCLGQLSKAIINALTTQECGFDDSLLFLARKVDNDSFVQSLEQCTLECLSKQKGDKRKYLYFKQNLLNSKIWSLDAQDGGGDDENKEAEKKDDKLLFDIMNTKIVDKELEYQKKYIRDHVIEEEKTNEKSWNGLKTKIEPFNIAKDNVIRQNRCLVDRGAVAAPGKREDDDDGKDDNDEEDTAVTKSTTLTVNGGNESDSKAADDAAIAAANINQSRAQMRMRLKKTNSKLGIMKAYARDYARVAINQTQLEEGQKLLSKVATMDLMGKKAVQADYTEKELPFDTVHGFDGAKIYDYNGYLVKLLIASHQINPVFQNDCEAIFNPKVFGIDCVYSGAPPKTADRCKMKASVDYAEADFPKTAAIIDLIRCSVCFENSEDLMKGFYRFIDIVNGELGDDEAAEEEEDPAIANARAKLEDHCIKKIVRIKNGFASFANVSTSDDADLKKFNYSDIKFNVIVEYNDVRLVGEVQFLLNFMQEAKKLGHSFYSFVRNDEYYNDINKEIVNGDKKLLGDKKGVNPKENEIRKIVTERNITLLYTLLENCNEVQKKQLWMENEQFILKSFDKYRWSAGAKLYKLFMTKWGSQ